VAAREATGPGPLQTSASWRQRANSHSDQKAEELGT
jgi:hypothetical protein